MDVNVCDPRNRSFFERPTAEVAVDLLGCVLHVDRDGVHTSGRIVETEAYLDQRDLASHAAWSRRGQDAMSRRPGTVYMYRAYGIHMMFNIVAKHGDVPGAVLVRALEPLSGVDAMLERRGVTNLRNIASGPGKLSQALGLELEDHLVDLLSSDVVYLDPGVSPTIILNSIRIGITRSTDLPLRFFDGESVHVSGSRQGIVWNGSTACRVSR